MLIKSCPLAISSAARFRPHLRCRLCPPLILGRRLHRSNLSRGDLSVYSYLSVSSAARLRPHLRCWPCPPFSSSAGCVYSIRLRPLIISSTARFRPLLGRQLCPPLSSMLSSIVSYDDQTSPGGDMECRTFKPTSLAISRMSTVSTRLATRSLESQLCNQISPVGDLEGHTIPATSRVSMSSIPFSIVSYAGWTSPVGNLKCRTTPAASWVSTLSTFSPQCRIWRSDFAHWRSRGPHDSGHSSGVDGV